MSAALGSVRRVVPIAAAGLCAAFLLGFLVFAVEATRPHVNSHGKADGIVVLTGRGARLGEAGRLLREGFGRRLLISGVNPKTRREDLERLTGLDDAGFRCCVDVGYAAQDTIGNADETRSWAAAHRFRRLIVVTASYHMPRGLAELGHAMPDVELTAHVVVPRDFATSDWWWDAGSLRVIAGEYLKFLSSSMRLAVSRLVAASDGSSTVERRNGKAMADRR